MSLRFTSTRVLGVAVALAFASVPAVAQQRDTTTTGNAGAVTTDTSTTTNRATSMRRIRVGKDRGYTTSTSAGRRTTVATDTATARTDTAITPAPVPAPTPTDTTQRDTTATMPTMPTDTTRRDTTTMSAPPAPTTDTTVTVTTTTSDVTMPPVVTGRFGNGFYIGLSAGGSLPQGYFNDWYKSGWNVGIPFGWQRIGSPIGVRGDINYSRLSGRDFAVSNFLTGSTADPQIWSAQLDLKLNLPLSPTSTWRPALYALGGGGVHYFKNFSSQFNATAGTGTGTTFQTNIDESSSQTKFGLNGGVGFSFGIGQADLFIESRYVSVFTKNNNTAWVPITVGITFF